MRCAHLARWAGPPEDRMDRMDKLDELDFKEANDFFPLCGYNDLKRIVMPKSVLLLIVGILFVLLMAYVGIPWLKNAVGFGSRVDVKVNTIWAVRDDKVNTPDGSDTVSRIVVEMEVVFPYGSAPDSLDEIGFRNDDGSAVEINWGNFVDRRNLEDRSETVLAFKSVFFPIDFKQGWLVNKKSNRELFYYRMPPLPYGAPPVQN